MLIKVNVIFVIFPGDPYAHSDKLKNHFWLMPVLGGLGVGAGA